MAKKEPDYEKLGNSQADNDTRAMILANPDVPPQNLPLPGPLMNPGFEIVPWRARIEMKGNVGKWTPSHLHIYTDLEKKPEHYPNAARNKKGELTHFCWACGRPTARDGLSGKRHRGTGKACPACGFRRKQNRDPAQWENIKKVNEVVAEKKGVELERPKDARLAAYKQQPRRGRTVNELMSAKAEERAESLLKPYFDGLELAPKDEWSPSTKLEFYMNQTQIAEKLLNRVEGMPVARTRHVDKTDSDVLREDELSPHVLAQMVAAIVTGTDVKELLGGEVVEDADFEEIDRPEE